MFIGILSGRKIREWLLLPHFVKVVVGGSGVDVVKGSQKVSQRR